ncbi:hypothetical protein FGO68_gene8843 [Halteria grandinella]|uniref:Uncharacterized protein n=1 Tax=Halteria grandinella TaxID=5974 RepID=A0A8J8SUJ8_HALGN|nr:hypothetical protein FGO68_gene8843 [Halteria grandinella]
MKAHLNIMCFETTVPILKLFLCSRPEMLYPLMGFRLKSYLQRSMSPTSTILYQHDVRLDVCCSETQQFRAFSTIETSTQGLPRT